MASVVVSGSGCRHLFLEWPAADANETTAFFRTTATFGCCFSSGGKSLSRVWNSDVKVALSLRGCATIFVGTGLPACTNAIRVTWPRFLELC